MESFLEEFLVQPEWWPVFLFLLPLGVVLGFLYIRNRSSVSIWFKPGTYTLFIPEIRLILRGIAVLFLSIAIVGPWWGRVEEQISQLGREVYFLIDVSASMNTEDIRPSRFSKVKKEVRSMINQLRGDKVGIIAFTTKAYVRCPLTNDYRAANLFLDILQPSQYASTGTDFRSALKLALDRFVRDDEEEDGEIKVRPKVTRSVVLISDGEHFGKEYQSVIERMQDFGITVFPVGVGTYAGGQVPDIKGKRRLGYKKNEDGEVAISKLTDESLTDIAQQFGVEYTQIDDPIDNLDPVLDQIQMQSASVVDRETRLSDVNRYQVFLLLTVLCLFASMVLMPFQTRQQQKGSST